MSYINYDNVYHVKHRMHKKGDLARDAVTEKYILGMRILMLGYEHAIKNLPTSPDSGLREHFDTFRKMAAKGAASTVLSLADYLPRLIDNGSAEVE